MATGGAVRTVGLREGLIVAAAVAVVAVAGLAVAEALDVTLLVDPTEHMTGRGAAAVIGVGLLVADVVLPVPSSVVMLAHGALFGVLPGALLSLVGRTGNAVAGVVIGRGAGRLLGGRRPSRSGRGAELVERWGLAAVVLTRPLPVLAESTLVAAAAMGLSPVGIVVAAVVGAVPEAVLYAVAGDVAETYASAAVVFFGVIVLAAVVWAVAARKERERS
ncbi:MAG: VTT domain-containing protein [Actinomycetota bacterium]|nr:VTT domain-containing protein [Actinomycetota bacterium]